MSYFYDVCLADMQKVMTTFGKEQFCNGKLVFTKIGHHDKGAFIRYIEIKGLDPVIFGSNHILMMNFAVCYCYFVLQNTLFQT